VLHAEPLDDAAAKTQKGLRIFVRDTSRWIPSRAAEMPEQAARRCGQSLASEAAPASPGGATATSSLVIMLDLETEWR